MRDTKEGKFEISHLGDARDRSRLTQIVERQYDLGSLSLYKPSPMGVTLSWPSVQHLLWPVRCVDSAVVLSRRKC